MTPYRVIWEPDAESMLADLWLDAADRNSITSAQVEVHRLLARDPYLHGRLLSEGLYRLRVGGLIVNFTVVLDARLVQITWVRSSP
jgi:mRNA-degrading endonuclease RelE of RelBE toxin-antitoxin system